MSRLSETTQLRMGPQMKAAIGRAAELEGVNASQFVREAAYARAMAVLLQRQDRWATIAQLLVTLGHRTRDPEVVRLTQLLMDEARDKAA